MGGRALCVKSAPCTQKGRPESQPLTVNVEALLIERGFFAFTPV